MELDEIIYTSILNNTTLASDTGGRIYSTCVEVPPMEDDNTPTPYIIVMEEASQNDAGTKDNVWESATDIVNVGVVISAKTPNEVKRLRGLIRQAVGSQVESMENPPYLRSLSYDGVAWDWQKPCYYDTLHYQCEIEHSISEEYEQETE